MHVALVTAEAARDLDEDLPPLVAALESAGARVDTPAWDAPAVDWTRYDVALLRSTWDYVERLAEFLAWTRRCAAQTRLLNPAEVVAWNVDKHYLGHLARRGVPVVPTRFVEPGTSASGALGEFLDGGGCDAGRCGPFDEFVVKPAVGAGSRDAARYRRSDRARALAHLERLVGAGRRSAMLQPYLGRVDDAGETALVYLGTEPSHAIRKGPLLRLGDGLVQGLFAPEDIRARDPADDERAVAAAAHGALPFEPPLYARVDLVRDEAGSPVVLELELVEPSLFFAHAPGSAARLAACLATLMSR